MTDELMAALRDADITLTAATTSLPSLRPSRPSKSWLRKAAPLGISCRLVASRIVVRKCRQERYNLECPLPIAYVERVISCLSAYHPDQRVQSSSSFAFLRASVTGSSEIFKDSHDAISSYTSSSARASGTVYARRRTSREKDRKSSSAGLTL